MLYIIACDQMKQTRKLIETVAQAITDDIREQYPHAESVQVGIKKLNPPLGGSVASSGVIINYKKA
jgi:dihydroneopterin aldolase